MHWTAQSAVNHLLSSSMHHVINCWAWRPENEARTMSLCPRSELDPELDSQNMVHLQLAPSVVILV